MKPFLSTRINLPRKIEEDHAEILMHMHRINDLISGLPNASTVDLESHPFTDLLAAWIKYEAAMLLQLKALDYTCLPLMRAYFSPDEVAPIVQEMIKSGPPVEMGSFIHYAGDEAFSDFMRQEGIPGFVWYVDFKPKRDRFRKVVKANIDALIQGVPATSFFC